jgi:protein-tyrosine phosphatase
MNEDLLEESLFTPINQIDNLLWIGNASAAQNVDLLREKGIQNVLCVHPAPHGPEFDGIRRLIVPFGDLETENILDSILEQCLTYIDSCITRGESVMVHCQAGVSRSGSIVVAYVMRSNDWHFDQALRYCTVKRPCIWPNPGFEKQLRHWHTRKFSFSSL